MSALAPTVQAFFTQRLLRERNASPHTIAAYRDTIRLLLRFAAHALRAGTLDARHRRSRRRHRSPRSSITSRPTAATAPEPATPGSRRSTRSTDTPRCAIPSTPTTSSACSRSHPNAPTARSSRSSTKQEIDALLAAPDRTTWTGRRDHALLLLAIQTGLRASELTTLNVADVQLAGAAHVTCEGKGRKQRITPLTRTTSAVLRVWLAERAGHPDDPLFPTIRGRRLTRDALERRLADPPRARRPATSRPCARRTSPCTRSGTPPRCNSCTPGSTPQSSPCG